MVDFSTRSAVGETSWITMEYSTAMPSNSTDPPSLDLYEAHAPAINFLDKYLIPVWYLVGFPGNILAFIVWIQPSMRPSSGTYLTALAMDDLVFLILKLIIELHYTWEIPILNVPGLCQGLIITFMASQYLDPLLVLGFTVERYISICHPFQREKFCTTKRAVKVIIGLLLFSLLLHAIQGYFWVVQDGVCDVRASVQGDLWTVWSWITELLVFGVVPISILVLNILVIVEVKRISRSEEKRCINKGHKSSSPSATTFMLLMVSSFLIVTTLPVTVCYSIVFSFPMGDTSLTYDEINADPTWQRHFTYWTVRKLIENISMSHYACNMYIYLLTGKVFRKEFKRLFCKRCVDLRKSKLRNGDFHELRSNRTAYSSVNGNIAHV